MGDASGGLTRRRFLEMVGLAGGYGAVYESMTAMGLIRVPDAWTGPPQLPRAPRTGATVLILGAGIGGLTAAFELQRAGYSCEILEALDRAGGRNFTVRRGTVITEESPEHGVTHQVAQLDDGLYLNLGPGRGRQCHRRLFQPVGGMDLLAPDGRFHFVGDQVSPLPGWMEGAMMSAQHVVEQVTGVRASTVSALLPAPDSRRMLQGRI